MHHNEAIGCTVTECSYHCREDMYCTLDRIDIVRHSPEVRSKDGTDCGSFEGK